MNEVLRRRLVGLAVLVFGLFLLSWFVPGGDGRGVEPGTPSTLVALGPGGAVDAASAEAAQDLPPAPEPAPAVAAPSAPPIADLTGDAKPAAESAQVVPAAPAVAPSPRATPKPAPSAPAEAPVTSHRPQPVPKLVPQKAEPAKPIAAKPAPKSAPPARPEPAEQAVASASGWWIQIGSYSDRNKAATILSLLRKVGHRGELSTIKGKKALLNRVRLGPYANEAAARAALPKVAHQGYPQAQVVSEPPPH